MTEQTSWLPLPTVITNELHVRLYSKSPDFDKRTSDIRAQALTELNWYMRQAIQDVARQTEALTNWQQDLAIKNIHRRMQTVNDVVAKRSQFIDDWYRNVYQQAEAYEADHLASADMTTAF